MSNNAFEQPAGSHSLAAAAQRAVGPAEREACVPRLLSNGIELEYEGYGDSSAPLVILVAGLGEQMGAVEFPREFCISLSRHGFCVVRFDNRDVGLSTHLHDAAPGSYSLLDMADDVAGLIAGLGAERAHLVGASMGGLIIRWVALRHARLVESLTIIMSGCGARPNDPKADRFSKPAPEALRRMLAKQEPAPSAETAIETYVEAWRSYNGSGYPLDEPWIRACAREAYSRSYDPRGVARQFRAILTTSHLLSAQEAIRCRTLVIHGDEDPICGADHARETSERIPGALLEIITGMGHEMPREAWPRMFRAISELCRAASAAQHTAEADGRAL